MTAMMMGSFQYSLGALSQAVFETSFAAVAATRHGEGARDLTEAPARRR
jgi:hypothetical protein